MTVPIPAPQLLTYQSDERVDLVNQYWNDWEAMAVDVWGVTMHDTLADFLAKMQRSRKLTRVGCHGSAKTFDAALAGLCYIHTRPDSRLITTAPSGRQVKKSMWAEINSIHAGARVKNLGSQCLTEEIHIGPKWFGFGFATDKFDPNKSQSFHAPGGVFLIFDETPGIAPVIYDMNKKTLMGPDDKFLTIGNAIGPLTKFGQSFKNPTFTKIVTQAEDCVNVKTGRMVIPGMVTLDWLADLQRECGKNYEQHPLYRQLALARFIEDEDEYQLIPTSWVTAAFSRWITRKEQEHKGHKIEGIDCARGGKAKTVYVPKIGTYVLRIEKVSTRDTIDITDHIQTESNKGWHCCTDVIGVGAGAYDEARRRGISCTAVNGAERTDGRDKTGQYGFVNRRSELWWKMREALDPANGTEDELLALPESDTLLQDLTAPRYDIKVGAKIAVEPKDKVMDRLGRSPDEGDALANTFARNYVDETPFVIAGSFTDEIREAEQTRRRW